MVKRLPKPFRVTERLLKLCGGNLREARRVVVAAYRDWRADSPQFKTKNKK